MRDPLYTRRVRDIAAQVLTAQQLRVVDHRLGRGMSFRQIAVGMHIDEATVRGHYDRALRKLEPILKEVA